MFGKKKDTGNVQKSVAAAASFEVTIGDLARKSERRAWMVAFASLLMSLALAGGYYYMLPLKEKVPYVVMADPFSGTASVAVLRDDPFFQSIAANETLARANIANYVTARESFDAELLKARDWAQVNVMSSTDERRAFAAQLDTANPSSAARLVKGGQVIRVRVSSITMIYDGAVPAGATVRIQRNLLDRRSGELQPIDRRIITMAFEYDPKLQLDESLRWLNPLGFLVTQYRNELDLSAMEPGNLEPTFNAAMESAAALMNERDASIDALKEQARALAAAGQGAAAAEATGSEAGGIAPPPNLTPTDAPAPTSAPPATDPASPDAAPVSTPPNQQNPNGAPAP